MRLTQVGFSHKNAPAGARESLARLEPRRVLSALREGACGQAVVLSTCNRFELYLCGAPAPSPSAAIRVIEGLTGFVLAGYADARCDHSAVLHLFEVVSGLDSLVVGETEILGQVKKAYEIAQAAGATGKLINVLFQRALYVGKKVRSDTSISVGQTSAASVAVQLAGTIFNDLTGCGVLVVGAGQMAELACRHFLAVKVRRLCVVNRSRDNAEALAARLSSRAAPVLVEPWEELSAAVSRADVVLSSTGAGRPVLTHAEVAAAMDERRGRPLFIIDIAMPRDVEEAVHGLENVYLYRLEDLERNVAENLRGRQGEIDRARVLVREKAAEFTAWADSLAGGRETSLSHSD